MDDDIMPDAPAVDGVATLPAPLPACIDGAPALAPPLPAAAVEPLTGSVAMAADPPLPAVPGVPFARVGRSEGAPAMLVDTFFDAAEPAAEGGMDGAPEAVAAGDIPAFEAASEAEPQLMIINALAVPSTHFDAALTLWLGFPIVLLQ